MAGWRASNLLPLWEKVALRFCEGSDEGYASRDIAAAFSLHPDGDHPNPHDVAYYDLPLIRLPAEPEGTFSHKGRRLRSARYSPF